MSFRDPRGNKNPGITTTNPQTGTSSMGGYLDAAVVDLGNGTGALATINVTRAKSTAGPFTSSTQLIAADVSRLSLTIVNNDATKNLYLGFNGAPAVAGTNVVAPNAAFNLDPKNVAGQVDGIWDAGATGTASLLATTA